MLHRTRTHCRPTRTLCVALMGLALCLPLTSFAEDDALTTAVKACGGIRKNSERLACYDTRVYPVATGAVVEAAPMPTPEEVFGAETSATPAATSEDAAAPSREEISKITARVTAMTTLPRGELQMELDNGQVWRQVEAHELLLHTGDTVTISRAALGTFRLKTASGRVSKVERVR